MTDYGFYFVMLSIQLVIITWQLGKIYKEMKRKPYN